MIDIVFLTTNHVKLAHARYLCRNFNVNIIQHKLLQYGIGYEEPRLFEREKLLEESVRDAILRWKINESESDNRLFILEDTSVKIHALSTDDQEVPGVGIKYWMRENTFEKLDLLLRESSYNRKVTVYSHLILILTKNLKKKCNISSDYITFKSQSLGKIVESEYSFQTNNLYPWLDNKSFNKWFVPEGEIVPISMLPILKADLCDFRKGAFDEMLEFLFDSKIIFKKRIQEINFRFIFNPIFLITGPTCAGKTTIGKYLSEKFNFYHIEASDFMTLEFLETHGNKSDIAIGEFAKEVLKVKPHIVVDRIISYLENIPNVSSLLITGFRTPSEIEYFNTYSPLRGNFITIYINADYETRFDRWLNRNRNLNDNQKSKFEKSNKLQKEMGLDVIRQLENISHIENNATFDEYYNLFCNSFLNDFGTEKILNNSEFRNVVPNNLKDAILLTLANIYKSDDQSYFTTTEISYKINQTFESLPKKKHKDNVSRYFNQRFYPYYEVKNINNKIKYRLSPTGYSMAQTLMRNVYRNS